MDTLTVELAIAVSGAGSKEIECGIAAAWKVLGDAGVSAWDAASAAFKQESCDRRGDFSELTERDGTAANAWREADYQAAQACCAGWPEIPNTAHLDLVYDRDAYNAWAMKARQHGNGDAALMKAIGGNSSEPRAAG